MKTEAITFDKTFSHPPLTVINPIAIGTSLGFTFYDNFMVPLCDTRHDIIVYICDASDVMMPYCLRYIKIQHLINNIFIATRIFII